MEIEKLFNFKRTIIDGNDLNVNLHQNSYYFKVKEIYNHEGFSHKNVGIYCKGVSKKLLIVVGESWTYGDSLHPYIKAIDGKDNIPYRISTIFAGKVANYLNSDLLLFAEPGDANINYWLKLEKMLEFVYEQNYYDDVYLIVQMTSPGRDYIEGFVPDRLKHLLSVTPNEFPVLLWDDWHYEYDKAYLNWLQEIVTKYPLRKTVLWKNFNEFLYKEREKFTYNVIETPFQRYAVEMSDETYPSSKNLEMKFYENVDKIYNLKVDIGTLENEMTKIDEGFAKLGRSMINNWHPNECGHWVLTTLFREQIEKNGK